MRLVIVIAAFVSSLASAAAEQCTLKRYATIPFATDNTSHIYIPATLGGHATKLMVDTGAYWSSIAPELVATLNLRVRKFDAWMFDLAGNRMDKLVTVPEVKVGDLSYGEADFYVGGSMDEPIKEFGGLLGLNLLTQVDLEIDNAGRTISLFSQDHCKGDGVYWATEAVTLRYKKTPGVVPMDSHIKRTNKNQIDPPIVSAELEGETVGILFDTGATNTTIDLAHAKRKWGIGPGSPGVEKAGQVYTASGALVETYRYTFKSLSIAGIRFENVPVLLAEFDNGAQVILGMNQMKHLRIYFSFKEGLIHVTAADAKLPQQ